MKTKIIIVAFTVAVIASFSFITISKHAINKNSKAERKQGLMPVSGFVLEDENQF